LPKSKAKPPQAPRTKDEGPRSAVSLAALALLVILAYSNSFGAGFVFDNRVLLLDDTRLRAVTPSNLNLIVNKPYWWPFIETPLYRPATTFSYLLNYSVLDSADRPLGYHVVNWVLHTANVWLVFGLAMRIGRRFWPAILLAALWAVHPLGTEAVTNIVGRADLLAAFGVLASFHTYLAAGEVGGAGRWAWMALSVMAMIVAVFSKESAIAGLGVIVLYDVLCGQKRFRVAESGRRWAILALPAVAFLYQRSVVLAGSRIEIPYVDNPIAGAGFWTGSITAIVVMGRYLALLLWPARLSADYSFSQIPLASGNLTDWLAWIVVAGVTAATLVRVKEHRLVSFCLGAAMLTFLPAANLLFTTGTAMAERLMYLPSAFLLAAIVTAVYSLEVTIPHRRLAPTLLGLAIVVCGVRTFARNADWHDDVSLWTATIATAPASFKSHDSLAEALYEADPSHGNLERVTDEKEKSLAILQELPEPLVPVTPYRTGASYYLTRGDWLQAQNGTPTEVAKAYQRAADLGERYLALARLHNIPASELSEAQLLVSNAYRHLGQAQRSLEVAQHGAADQPFNPAAYRDLSAALLSVNRSNDAAVELMTGFMVTGDEELRRALIALYQTGLDATGCATTVDAGRPSLNVSCEIVRRHLCEAAARAGKLQTDHGHPDLAAQASTFTRNIDCPAVP
jgi:protein O-mannosyl-transferase